MRTLALLFAAALLLGGCAANKRAGDVLVADTGDLMPHNDRDHFVYAGERSGLERAPERSLMVEHVSALPAPGQFVVTESSDGERTGDARWQIDDRGVWLLSEDVEGLGVRLSYDPPLLLFPQPLLVGEHRASSTGAATRLDDGQPVGVFRASVLVSSKATRSDHPLAKGPAVALAVTRSLEGPNGALILHVDSVNLAGLGEVESVAAFEGTPIVIRRSLVCGFINGKAFGDCSKLR